MSDHAQRLKAEPWRAWYKTARWQRLRWSVLVRDGFTCRRCKRLFGDTSQLVAHHKVAHKGQADLFWDDANLITECKPCHDRDSQSEEKGGRPRTQIGADGWPVDQ